MREELELTHEASSAAKVFLKEKLAKSEESLEEYKSEFFTGRAEEAGTGKTVERAA